MPEINIMAGDFNIRHNKWDFTYKRPNIRNNLIAIANGDLNLILLNPENGKKTATWSSNREDQSEGVLDLFWSNEGYQVIKGPIPHMDLRFKSDHAPVFIEIDIEIKKEPRYSVKKGLENRTKFIQEIRSGLIQLPKTVEAYNQKQDIEEWGDFIQRLFEIN